MSLYLSEKESILNPSACTQVYLVMLLCICSSGALRNWLKLIHINYGQFQVLWWFCSFECLSWLSLVCFKVSSNPIYNCYREIIMPYYIHSVIFSSAYTCKDQGPGAHGTWSWWSQGSLGTSAAASVWSGADASVIDDRGCVISWRDLRPHFTWEEA